jgi:hypothetical protein
MQNSESPPFKHFLENKGLAKNNSIETEQDFRKDYINLTIIEIDNYLKELENSTPLSELPKRNTLHKVRDHFFKLCNLWVYGCDIEKFVSHESGDKTPLNSTEC